jgi:curved DNA-binding protein CbpA
VIYNAKDDFYTRLGVAHDAPISVIKSAYRVRMRSVHPDIHGAAGHAETLRLNEAWAVIGDATKRPLYDAARRRHRERRARRASPPRDATRPEPSARPARRSSRSRPRRAATPKAEPRSRRPPNAKRWSGPTEPSHFQVDAEAIAETIDVLTNLIERLLDRRRAPL